MVIRSAVLVHLLAVACVERVVRFIARLDRREGGQSTVEYALVLLGAAAVALLLVAWATKSNRIGKLLDVVFDQLVDRATT